MIKGKILAIEIKSLVLKWFTKLPLVITSCMEAHVQFVGQGPVLFDSNLD